VVDTFSLRDKIDQCLAAGDITTAVTSLARLWRQEAGPSTASYINSRYEKLRADLNLISSRLYVLRSFTVEPLIPLLRAAAFVNGMDLHVQVSDFNTYAQELLDPTSRLYDVAPDVVLLAVQTRDIAPDLWEAYPDLSPQEATAAVERLVGEFRDWVQALRARSQAHFILHNLEMPLRPSQGILDTQAEASQIAAIRQINQELHHVAHAHAGVYVLDYDALIARHGRVSWHDEHKWLTMRMPIAADKLKHLAQEWLRFLHPLVGKVCKALVTDLDNTLWGGVIGEDGIQGIQIGQEYPGAAYRALQRVMLDLYQRGIILAVCSKNNPADAMEALEHHAGMLLRPQHFAALRINWNDKVQNLREIADELNIGIDALAFLDDNPIERERVRTALPDVTVIELAGGPMTYAQTLRDAPVFERLVLSEEDQLRGRYYAEQRQRLDLERSVGSLEDFYRSLEQEVEMAPVTPESLVRITQLTQKTNQFNLTTRRYTEQQIMNMLSSPDWNVYAIRVTDRFGDNGLVGVVITHDDGAVCDIDTFLLSCRVIGRTVETAALSFLAEQARARGMKRLQGWFLPTKKNAPAKDCYATHHFQVLEEQDNGSLWTLDLGAQKLRCPEWIKLTVCEGVLSR
jgi:FkbH-like protein